MKTALVILLSFIGFAIADPKPVTAVKAPTIADYEKLIDEAIVQVTQIQKELDQALTKQKETGKALAQANQDLFDATKNAKQLQTEIDFQAWLLKNSKEREEKVTKEKEEYRLKYEDTNKKLWWWRLTAGSIIGLVLLYFVLKFTTKLPL